MTIVPNFLITGVLAILVSLTIIIWTTTLAQRKNGGIVTIVLSLILLLVGGGFTPIPFGILAGVAASMMNSSSTWWRAHLYSGWQHGLAKLWPWSLVASVLWYSGISQLGPFFRDFSTILGALGLIFILLAVLAGFAHDIQRQTDSYQPASLT